MMQLTTIEVVLPQPIGTLRSVLLFHEDRKHRDTRFRYDLSYAMNHLVLFTFTFTVLGLLALSGVAKIAAS